MWIEIHETDETDTFAIGKEKPGLYYNPDQNLLHCVNGEDNSSYMWGMPDQFKAAWFEYKRQDRPAGVTVREADNLGMVSEEFAKHLVAVAVHGLNGVTK